MNVLHPKIISIVIIFSLVCTGCSCDLFYSGEKRENVCIMSYNVQLLFDSVDDGDEYSPFTLEDGYSHSLYLHRLESLAKALTQQQSTDPDVIILQEVENDQVVRDLLNMYLKKRGFTFYVVSEDPQSPIEVAIISRYEIIEAHIHSTIEQRPIMEAVINIQGENIRVFALHLRSQRAGFEESEKERLESITALSSIIDRYDSSGIVLPTIIAGDFNESITEYEKYGGSIQTALIPYNSISGSLNEVKGSLFLTGGVVNDGLWYTFYLDSNQMNTLRVPGSYYYQGVWESFDHVLLSNEFFDGIGLDFEMGGIKETPLLLNEEGVPFRYNTYTHEGFSDHLPVYVILSIK